MSRNKLAFIIIMIVVALLLLGSIFTTKINNETHREIKTTLVVINNHDSRIVDKEVIVCDNASVKDQLIISGINFDNSIGYVSSIEDIKSDKNSGWVFEVNDEVINVNYEQYKLKENDVVVWKFIEW